MAFPENLTWQSPPPPDGEMSNNPAFQTSQRIDQFLLSSKIDMDRKQSAMQILLLGGFRSSLLFLTHRMTVEGQSKSGKVRCCFAFAHLAEQ